MGKIAILTDSNSGITQSQAQELGIKVLPMPFTIDGRDYLEDINLTQKEFFELLSKDADIHTSQPSPAEVMDTWKELLREYDEIVHIPMSSGLSSSCANALTFAEDFDGRVQVVNNQRISVTQRQSVLDAMRMAETGFSAAQIKDRLEETKFDSSIYIMLNTLKYLKKGGRITPAAAAFAELLNLKPILQIQGEKLDAFSKCRGIKQAKNIMINAIRNDIEHRFKCNDSIRTKIWLEVAHTDNEEAAEQFVQEISEAFDGYPVKCIHADPLSLSIACHIGPGALAVACTKVLPEGEQPEG
ncbi:MAG: DegV family protein [Lachnospiraceae bacterium]|nr:DegV family protein [Lachnospiraceae bacterium]